ncbi:polyprenyl diphosphate synthase [Candidatus Methanoperedens nitratireducens]|uniref:Di-trans,poly-cis-decaprenylcistransferase n=1 Tax=Candidatus Methanoperedens nitratireducens TaxID=1392998 RepID=A0A284VJN7_9EURY|nr:polyprenyl diphosphate synthase [Candidatus Methanoperedens nitroreducens]SNQ59470.1 Di-trans,poly-cis-decaprenylcistransferase [Candidatus Methanoperedens nitroreducens]
MLKLKRMPKHIGIIPDGNRRWAVAKGLQKEDGYEYGIEPGKMLFEEVRKLGIPEVSIYIFTQENTFRPRKQIAAFQNAFLKFLNWIKNKDVSILAVGDASSPFFPEELKVFTVPQENREQKMKLNFLINYSWKWDLNMALVNSGNKRLRKQDILKNIGSKDVSRVDLLIRWGERRRLSGFLPVQSAYADIYIVKEMWPDFKPCQLHEALKWYEVQDVTLGG